MNVYSSFSNDFVSPLFPKKGELVKLSIVFSERPEKVLLRHYTDVGLVITSEATSDGEYNGGFLYSVTVPASSDEFLFRYFFVFFAEGKSYYYSKRGITRNTPKQEDRFSLMVGLKAPTWTAGATCYQIFPDRFFNGNPAVGAKSGEYEFDGGSVTTPRWDEDPKEWIDSRCVDFYNGDLKGIEEKIGYFKSLGVDTLYINPIFESRSVHRYDTVDFSHVDRKLGGDEALVSLVERLHESGIKVILDISINHTGPDAIWLKKALADKGSVEHGYYYFREDGRLECWQDVPTLPQLNYNSAELRKAIYKDEDSILKKYLKAPFNIDGWRLDVAPEVGRRGSDQLCQELWRDVRKELKDLKEDLYIVGEDWDDSAEYMGGDMWDATMNYYGAGRPIRSWMGQRDRFLATHWGMNPGYEKPWTGEEMASALLDGIHSVPGQSAYFQMNLIDSHDTPRLHNDNTVMDEEIYKGAVETLFFLPGYPSIYYGDEVLLRGHIDSNEGCRYPMCWDEGKWNKTIQSWYARLAEMRKRSWFPYSSFSAEPLDEEAFLLKRFSAEGAFLGVVNRGEEEREFHLDLFALPRNELTLFAGKGDFHLEGEDLVLKVSSKASMVLELK